MKRRNVQRNGRSKRAAVEGGRWAAWAGRTIARYARTAAAWRAPNLLQAHPGVLARRIMERWLAPSLRIYPQLNLAIQPHVFFNGVWAPPAARVLSEVQRFRVETQLRHTTAVSPPLSSVRHTTAPSAREVRSRAAASLPSRRALAPPGALREVFARLYRLDEFTRVHRRQDLVLESARFIAERIVRRSARAEETVTRPAAILKAPMPLASKARKESVAESPNPFRRDVAAPLPSQFTRMPAPQVNVDQIADHVLRKLDHRVTAWRERAGRV